MGKKTSVYLTEELAASVAESGIPLASIIRQGLKTSPRLIEESPGGDFITHWYCEVPARDARFRVLDEEWHQTKGQVPIRKIYEIKVTDPGLEDQ